MIPFNGIIVVKTLCEQLVIGLRRVRVGEAIIKQNKSKTTTDILFPSVKYIKEARYDDKKAKRIVILTSAGLVVVAGGEYYVYKHNTIVPIIERKQHIFLSREDEMHVREHVAETLSLTEDSLGESPILEDKTDYRYCLVNKVIDILKRACIYYDPESESYFNNMQVIVVDSPVVNAFSSIGGYIIVYTGIVDYYLQQKEENKIENVEEAVASVLAHEMGHSLARHSVETLLHISSLYFYTAALLLGDVFIVPQIKKMYDNHKSTQIEYEADCIGMYLMKRGGYSTKGYIDTISSLPEMIGLKVNKTLVSLFLDHPEPYDRKEALEKQLLILEEDFKTKYTVEETTSSQKLDYFMQSVQTTWAWLISCFSYDCFF